MFSFIIPIIVISTLLNLKKLGHRSFNFNSANKANSELGINNTARSYFTSQASFTSNILESLQSSFVSDYNPALITKEESSRNLIAESRHDINFTNIIDNTNNSLSPTAASSFINSLNVFEMNTAVWCPSWISKISSIYFGIWQVSSRVSIGNNIRTAISSVRMYINR